MTVSYVGILAAAVVGFVFGSTYYGLLGKVWLKALGKSEADVEAQGGSYISLAITFVLQLLMAWVMAGLLLHLAKSGVPASFRNGALSGAFIALGFVAPAIAVNYRFAGSRPLLTLVDGGHWLGVFLIQGAIIGAWAIR